MAEHQAHDEERESEAEQMDVGYPDQRKDIGARILLGHFLQVFVAA